MKEEPYKTKQVSKGYAVLKKRIFLLMGVKTVSAGVRAPRALHSQPTGGGRRDEGQSKGAPSLWFKAAFAKGNLSTKKKEKGGEKRGGAVSLA